MTERRPRKRRSRGAEVGAVGRLFLPSLGSFCILLVLNLLLSNSWRLLLDSDTGWHIRAGDLILAGRSVIRRDPFSHTMAGGEWFSWEWLTEAAMALLHRWRGLPGVAAGAILALLGGYLALNRRMARLGSDPVIAFALTIFASLCSIVQWLARPHLVSVLLLTVWLWLVEDYRRHRARRVWLIVPLIALWANLHGAFSVTFALLAVYAAGEWIEWGLRGEWWSPGVRRVVGTYAGLGAASLLAAMANPFGPRLLLHIFEYLSDRGLLSSIVEFKSPDFQTFNGRLIELLLLVGVVSAGNALRRGGVVEAGLVLFWSHLTLQSERHVTLAVVAICPVAAEQLTLLAGELADRWGAWRPLGAGREWYRGVMEVDARLSVAAYFLGAAALVAWLPSSAAGKSLLPQSFSPERFPVAAADFIERANLPGNMFAADQYGGYLIYRLYPRLKVFVDGRSDFYRQQTVLADTDAVSQAMPGWEKIVERYGVRWMLLKRDDPLARIALMGGYWNVVYEDGFNQVLLKK